MSSEQFGEWYPKKPPVFGSSGDFEAIVAATDEQHVLTFYEGGVSACVLEIRQLSPIKTSDCYVYVSKGDRSDESRAYVAAIAGVLEALPDASRVLIKSRATYVVNGINQWLAEWKERGWLRADNTPPAAIEIWQRVDTVWVERKLSVRAEHIGKKDHALITRVNDLKLAARKLRDEQATKLGSPNSRFTIEPEYSPNESKPERKAITSKRKVKRKPKKK